MATRSKNKSYEAINDEDNEDAEEEQKYTHIEMADNNATIPKTPNPTNQQSHPSVIRAFSEISFKQHQSAKRIKNRVKQKKINPIQAEGELKKAYKTLAHTLTKQELSLEYETSLTDGLSTQRINELQSQIGFNELTPPPRDPEWLRFLKATFGNLMSVLLSVGAVLSLLCYGIDPATPKDYSSLILGFVLIGVVLLTGLFIFFEEGKSSNLMDALSALKPANIRVVRSPILFFAPF